MSQILGNFIQEFPPEHDSLELCFTPTTERIKQRWRHQLLSAHFVADYFTNFLPLDDKNPVDEQRIKDTKGTVKYISNELLENAMKFNLEASGCQVKLGIHFLDRPALSAVMFATNCISKSSAEAFLTFLKRLLSGDPEEMYMQQVEAIAEDQTSELSGLGFLTMINDYEAKLGWRFSPLSSTPDIIAVTSMAQVIV